MPWIDSILLLVRIIEAFGTTTNCSNSSDYGWPPISRFQFALILVKSLTLLLFALLEGLIAPDNTHFRFYRESYYDHEYSSSSSPNNGSSGGNRGGGGGGLLDNEELVQAYEFLHLHRGKCTQEEVTKAWKNLALKHHPDRNVNSRESKEMTQKLNHYRDLIMNTNFSSKDDDDDVMDNESDREYGGRTRKNKNEQERQDENPENKRAANSKEEAKKKRQKERYKKNKEQNRQKGAPDFGDSDEALKEHMKQMEALRKDLDKIRKDQEDIGIGLRAMRRRHLRDLKRDQQRKNMCDEQGVDTSTKVGRDKAHDLWMEQTKFHASTSSHTNTNGNGNQKQRQHSEKAVNLIMEQCTNDIAVAMRLGLHDTAAQLLFRSCARVRMNPYIEDECKAIQYLLESHLDDDQNTLWHYAVYCESDEILSALLAFYSDSVETRHDWKSWISLPQPRKMMLQKNSRGQLPEDFLRCPSGSYASQRVKNLTNMAREEINANTVESRTRRLLSRVDVFAVLYTLGVFQITCRYLFGCSCILSSLACLMQSQLTVAQPRLRVPYTIMGLGLYKVVVRPLWGCLFIPPVGNVVVMGQ